jgi:hypothetical protein
MLAASKAVAELQEGCALERVPPHAAYELLEFLHIRKEAAENESGQHEVRALGCSPSHSLDKLWHWMLLNTDVCHSPPRSY